jgi:molybdate transport system substrate-binding protein
MPMPKMTRRTPIAIAIAAAVGLAAPASASALTVYSASSLRDVFMQIDSTPTYNFAGSNQLQTQIQAGAPADVFASASPAEPQAVFKSGNCLRPVTFATNKLVMIVPKANTAKVTSVYSLRKGGLRVSIGTAGVPIGSYTRSVLKRLGLTGALGKNTVSEETNVAGIVSKIALGSADVGFAYVTDAKIASTQVRAIRLPTYAQPPVRYGICVVKRPGADTKGATAFIAKVRSTRGRSLLKKAGFGLPPAVTKPKPKPKHTPKAMPKGMVMSKSKSKA